MESACASPSTPSRASSQKRPTRKNQTEPGDGVAPPWSFKIKRLRTSLDLLLLAIAPGLLLRLQPRSAKTRGAAGERLAERHLRGLGHEVLARNCSHPAAELDLVSQTATHLVVTEVKTTIGQQRSLRRRFSSYAIERQRIAVRALAQRFHKEPRLDLMEVHMDPKTARIRLTHRLDL